MQAFWFGTIAVLWAGFLVLEGFDFGVGMLLPVVGRDELGRRMALRSIGPFWDGNEVWLLVAGGATFAAFPEWYASVFSGFYLAFVLLLAGLIVRGVSIEYRGKAETAAGRQWCDRGIIVGSTLPALLLGVAFADFVRGVRMDSHHNVTGGFFELLSPYALLGGLLTLTIFAYHGAVFLVLRTDGEVADTARRLSRTLAPVVAVIAIAFVGWTAAIRSNAVSLLLGVLVLASFVVSALVSRRGRDAIAFAASAITLLLVPIWVFAALWPDVLPARNNSAWSLTVHNASSTPYTLKVMTVVALVFTPVVLVYQAWTYWVFRARVTGESMLERDSYGGLLTAAANSARQTLGIPAPDGQPPAEVQPVQVQPVQAQSVQAQPGGVEVGTAGPPSQA